MAISKVTLNGTTLMDATTATAAAGDVIAPKTAMLKNGVVTTGTGTSPTGTKQISIIANGTTTEDVTNYANAEITVNVSGGGGGGLTVIESVTLAEAVNAVRLDFAGWEDVYDFLVVVLDTACAVDEWIYAGFDTTSPATYAPKNIHKFVLTVFKSYTISGGAASQTQTFIRNLSHSSSQISAGSAGEAPTFFYAKLYYAANKFSVGSKFTVYGGTYAI